MKRLKGLPKKIASFFFFFFFFRARTLSQEEIFVFSSFEKSYREKKIFYSQREKSQSFTLSRGNRYRQKQEGWGYILWALWFNGFLTFENCKYQNYSIDEQTNAFLWFSVFLGSAVKSKTIFVKFGIKHSYRHILQHAVVRFCIFQYLNLFQPDVSFFFENEYTSNGVSSKIFSRNITVKTPKTTFQIKIRGVIYGNSNGFPSNFFSTH